MFKLLLGFVLVVYCAPAVWANGDNDYLSKIRELSKKGTPQGNPELEEYLKSLTRDEMLTATRQFCKVGEKQLAEELWAQGSATAALPLAFYQNANGSLSDESVQRLLTAIEDQKEGMFFRYVLVNICYSKYVRELTEAQTKKLIKTLSVVLDVKESPDRLRVECCRTLRSALLSQYIRIIYSDPAVREVKRTGTKEQRQALSAAIDSGQIKLAARTKERVVPWRARVKEFRQTLVALSKDEKEPPIVRQQADLCLKSLQILPLLDVKESVSKPPMN